MINSPTKNFESFLIHSILQDAKNNVQNIMVLPFDTIKNIQKELVKCGVFKDSMIEQARFARDLHALEQSSLGVFARRK